MTDRHSGYLVTLKTDIREDDAEALIVALRQFSAVVDVQPVLSDPLAEMVAAGRRDAEWQNRLITLLGEMR